MPPFDSIMIASPGEVSLPPFVSYLISCPSALTTVDQNYFSTATLCFPALGLAPNTCPSSQRKLSARSLRLIRDSAVPSSPGPPRC